MMDVKWIKIVTDIFDDEKILLIESLPKSDSILVIWFKLLCLAGKQNNNGVLIMNNKIPYTEKMLASIFRRKESTIKLALQTFQKFGMIEIIDNVITIPNWEKHQTLDKIELAKEQTRKRVAKYREKQKSLIDESNVTSNAKCNVTSNAKCNVTVTQEKRNVTPTDKEIDIDKELDKDIYNNNNNNIKDSNVNDSCVDGLQETIDFYNNNIGMITPYGLTILEDYVQELGKDVVIYAMQISVEANKRTIQYIKGILNNWKKAGIKTIIEAKQESNKSKSTNAEEEFLNEQN